MPVKPFDFYNPTNEIRYDYTPIKEMQISGQQSVNLNGYSRMNNISQAFSSEQVTIGYDVTITYTGGADIGNSEVIKRRIPNYWKDGEIIARAKQLTNTHSDYTCGQQMAFCLSILTCTYCCFRSSIDSNIRGRWKRRDDKIDELACERMGQAIGNILKEADELITKRIKYKEEQAAKSTPIAAGNVVLSADQLQGLLSGFHAQGHAFGSQVSNTGMPMFVPQTPMVMQYQQAMAMQQQSQNSANASPQIPSATQSLAKPVVANITPNSGLSI